MDPLLLNFVTGLSLELIHEFKHRDDVPTEAEIKERFESRYAEFLVKNKALQEETQG